MARKKSRTLTELELTIMRSVWSREASRVEQIAEDLAGEGKKLAPPSIRTMLGILREKGYLDREKAGRGYTYRAVVSAEEARGSIVGDLVNRVFEGSAAGLVAALVSRGMIGKDDLAEARRLIREHDKGEKK